MGEFDNSSVKAANFSLEVERTPAQIRDYATMNAMAEKRLRIKWEDIDVEHARDWIDLSRARLGLGPNDELGGKRILSCLRAELHINGRTPEQLRHYFMGEDFPEIIPTLAVQEVSVAREPSVLKKLMRSAAALWGSALSALSHKFVRKEVPVAVPQVRGAREELQDTVQIACSLLDIQEFHLDRDKLWKWVQDMRGFAEHLGEIAPGKVLGRGDILKLFRLSLEKEGGDIGNIIKQITCPSPAREELFRGKRDEGKRSTSPSVDFAGRSGPVLTPGGKVKKASAHSPHRPGDDDWSVAYAAG